jgi:hypothetical protein
MPDPNTVWPPAPSSDEERSAMSAKPKTHAWVVGLQIMGGLVVGIVLYIELIGICLMYFPVHSVQEANMQLLMEAGIMVGLSLLIAKITGPFGVAVFASGVTASLVGVLIGWGHWGGL